MMRADLSALWYVEYRQIVNRVRHTLRQPGRAAVYVIALVYFTAVAIIRTHGHRAMGLQQIPEPYASAAFFTYVTLLGVVSYGAASGIAGAFSSSADARFLTGSHIAERIVVLWLQLRRSASGIARMFITIVLYAAIFSRSANVFGIGAAAIGGALIAGAIAVPMLKLRQIAGARTAQGLAGALAAIGLLPLLIVLSSLGSPSQTAVGIARLGAGAAFNALFRGNPLALGSLYVCGALLIALAYALGDGLYPDLYAASLRVLGFLERQKRGGTAAFSMEHAYERHASRPAFDAFLTLLSGPWTIAWKEWVGFVRSPSMQRLFAFGFCACGICGLLIGTAAARSHDPFTASMSFAAMAANMIVIFVAMGSAIGVASDLRKPLWWMGPDPLWMRLCAWVAGTSWRLALALAAGVCGWALAMRAPAIAYDGIPLAIAAVLYLRAVGLALYALFPSTIDQRGPLAMVRALLTYLLAAPPAIAGAVLAVLAHNVSFGVILAIAISMIETLLLIAFASSRIDGRGLALAQAEGM